MEWLKRCSDEGANLVVFSGAADPFTHKALPEFIETSCALGMHPFCYTQAHIGKRKVREVTQAGLTEVMVSIHGHDAERHEANTRSVGSFKRTMKGLSLLREAGLYTLTNTVVTRHNVDFIDELVDLLAFQYGVEEMAFSFPRVEGSMKQNTNCIPPFKEAATTLERVLKRLRAAGKRATVEYMPFCYLSPNLYEHMPDYRTLYKDASYDLYVKPSEVEWHFPDSCQKCAYQTAGCQGVDRWLPFSFEAGHLKPTVANNSVILKA